jgi:acyl carrier protein
MSLTPDSAAALEPPADRNKVILLQLFSEILGVPDVTVSDDFFELGGHSLLGLRLINRVRTELSVDLELYHLFDAPTVAELALEVEVAAHVSGPPQ